MPPITARVPKPDRVETITTDQGTARARIHTVAHGVPRASLVLGHGSDTGPNTPDLLTLATTLPKYGIEVVLVEQPWFVDGNGIAPEIEALDASWTEIVAALRRSGVGLRKLVVGGHSNGARVACRTVARTRPDAVLCLAFPLYPAKANKPHRGPELAEAAAAVPTTVIQGTSDKYGGPPDIATAAAEHGQAVIAVAIPFVDHMFHLAKGATITDSEARLILTQAARRAVMRGPGNIGPLLER